MMNRLITVMVMICIMQTSCRQSDYSVGIEHVVVIGLDGLSSVGLHAATTPCMDSLLQHGAYSYTVRCVLPTVSTPNWNAMLCGAGPEATGAVDNSWNVAGFKFPYTAMTKDHSFPNIFRVLRTQRPDAELGAIYNWDGFRNLLENELLNVSATYPTQLQTAQKSAEYILAKRPTFLFIQLDGIDHEGHAAGHMSSDYVKYVGETDTHVKLIVDAIGQAGIADKTMIMVVSDHGGIFHGHGGNSFDELVTPIIFAGKGVKQNYAIQQQIYRYDVAADIAFALGVKAPQVWTGRPTKPAYVGFDEPDNLWTEANVLPSPRFASETYNPPFGRTFSDSATVVIIAPEGTEGVIRYTTDESTPTCESSVYLAPFMVKKTTVVNAKLFNDTGESVNVKATYELTGE